MHKDSVNWRGFIEAVVTPMREDGSIDEEAFLLNLEQQIDEGVHGFLIVGCTGEHWALAPEEKRDLFRLAVQQVKGRVTVICGVSANNTADAIRLMRYAYEAGADGAMSMPPAVATPNDREIVEYFKAITRAVDIPVLAYNIPSRQVVNMKPELVSKLADIPNVVAIKESSGDPVQIVETIRVAGDRIRVFVGYDTGALFGIAMGAYGCMSIGAQVIGRRAVELITASLEGDLATARARQFDSYLFWKHFGSPAVGSFPAWLKEAMNLLGRPGGYPRAPILPVTDEERERIRVALRELNATPVTPRAPATASR